MPETIAIEGSVPNARVDLGKHPNRLKTWRGGEPVSASKLNTGVNALNRIITGVGVPIGSSDGTRRPNQLYVATETKTAGETFGTDNSFLGETIKARKINREGESDQPEVEYAKVKGVSIDEGAICMLVVAGTARPTLQPIDSIIPELYVQQANSAMPDNGTNFPPTILWGKRYDIIAVLTHWKDFAGTFECQLNIDGSDISGTTFDETDFNATNLQGKIFDESIPYNSVEEITVKVVSSAAVEEWEAIFWMREVFFREGQ